MDVKEVARELLRASMRDEEMAKAGGM
jgi:hypothetical protein